MDNPAPAHRHHLNQQAANLDAILDHLSSDPISSTMLKLLDQPCALNGSVQMSVDGSISMSVEGRPANSPSRFFSLLMAGPEIAQPATLTDS